MAVKSVSWNDFNHLMHNRHMHHKDYTVRLGDVRLLHAPTDNDGLDLSIKVGNSILTGATRQGMSSFLERTGNIPLRFFRKCTPQLRSNIISEFLGHNRKNTVLMRTHRTETSELLRFVGSDVYVPYNDMDLIEDVSAAMNPAEVRDVVMDFDHTGFIMLFTNFAFCCKRDFIPAIQVVNSETGMSSVRISIYLYEVVCTNGLIVPRGHGGVIDVPHVRARKEMEARLREGIQSSISAMGGFVRSVQGAMNQFGSWSGTTLMETVQKHDQLSQNVKKAVAEIAPQYGDSALDVISAITQVARDTESFVLQDHLRRVAGELLMNGWGRS